MLTRTCKFGESCKFDHPIWVPAGGIPDWKEVTIVTIYAYENYIFIVYNEYIMSGVLYTISYRLYVLYLQ